MPDTNLNQEAVALPASCADYAPTTCACAQCSVEVERDGATEFDGDYYCGECIYHCDECGSAMPSESGDARVLGDYIYCGDECARGDGWRQCRDCGEWTGGPRRTRARGSFRVSGYGDVCDNCVDNYYSCEDCGELFRERQVCFDEREGVSYCRDCRPQERDRAVQDYGYKPRAILSKMAWENTTYLGLELEVECGGRDRETMVKKLKAWLDAMPDVGGRKLSEYLYFKHDSSLAQGGADGVEIVWHPFTLKAFHKKFPLRKFMLKLKDMGFRGYQSGHCGLHVHISRAGFKNGIAECSRGDAPHVGKVFFCKCMGYLKKFSRRKNFDYCHFDSSLPRDGFRQDSGRYSAFNTSASAQTYEIRIFRGTIDYKRFLASVQFADAFAQYIPARSLAFMLNNSPAVIWQDFLGFCKKEQKWGQFVSYVFRNRII